MDWLQSSLEIEGSVTIKAIANDPASVNKVPNKTGPVGP